VGLAEYRGLDGLAFTLTEASGPANEMGMGRLHRTHSGGELVQVADASAVFALSEYLEFGFEFCSLFSFSLLFFVWVFVCAFVWVSTT
jgi:hypothetical protein